ncbi:MAG TPA: GrpB family protein [Herpetosiphonaceae bacterium]|nr:GrpB family protein [Herpetosiphonaceae bacterium]
MQLHQTDPRWSEQYAEESSRLRTLLGEIPEGGIIENIEHFGATSVPGALAQPCIDIGLAVWPFPLEPARQSALEALGYTLVQGHEGAPEQRFSHADGTFQLHVVDSGSELWTHYIIIRDYLRHDGAALQTYNRRKQEYAETLPDSASYESAEADLLHQTLDAARRWWVDYHGFAPVHAVVQELGEFAQPWYISSGWALDLFLGRVARVHHDVDVVIARSDQISLQAHMTGRGWKFVTPHEGALEPWPPHMRLEHPRIQAHAHREGAFIDFLLSDIGNAIWHYRRDPVVIRGVERMSLRTPDGIPFLAPELVLLFKSKNTSGRDRPKDQGDFDKVRDLLEPERRAWLRWALLRTDPAHPWIAELV